MPNLPGAEAAEAAGRCARLRCGLSVARPPGPRRLAPTCRCGVKDYESVADHSWRMALLSLLFANTPDVDHVRCMKIGLVVACIASTPLRRHEWIHVWMGCAHISMTHACSMHVHTKVL